MQPCRWPSRRGGCQPKELKPTLWVIPDQAFNDLFATLKFNRDRALIAFYISTRCPGHGGQVEEQLAPPGVPLVVADGSGTRRGKEAGRRRDSMIVRVPRIGTPCGTRG